MSSEQLADGVNPLDAELAATWDVLKGYSGRDTDLGIARRFGGAAAAYSLRDIGAMNGPVVNVRREPHDDDDPGVTDETDFSASQVSSGVLEDWVNGKLETTLPADVATAAAAYSLRKVKDEPSLVYTADFSSSSDGLVPNSTSRFSTAAGFTYQGKSNLVLFTSANTASNPQFWLNNNDFLAGFSGSITFEYYVESDSPLVGNKWVVGSSLATYTKDGVTIVGGAWTTATVFFGSYYGGTDKYKIATGIEEVGRILNAVDSSGQSVNCNVGEVIAFSSLTASVLSPSAQIRRSSDDIEVNVHFDSDGNVSNNSLVSNVGEETTGSSSGSTTATDLNGFLNESTENFSAVAYADIDSDFKQFTSTPTISDTAISGATGSVDALLARLAFKLPSQLSISDYSGLKIKVTGTVNSFTADESLVISPSKVANGGTTFTPPEGGKVITSGTTGNFEFIFTGDTTNTFQSVVFKFGDNSSFDISNLKFEIIEHGATVHTWYDQAGVNNATQATAANQPKIAENGALLADGLLFDDSNDFLQSSSQVLTGTTNNSIYCVVKTLADNGYIAGSAGTGVGMSIYAGTTKFILSNNNTAGASTQDNIPMVNNQTVLISANFDDGTTDSLHLNSYANGYANGSSSYSITAGTKFTIGARDGSTAEAVMYKGSIQEIIAYDSFQGANRFKIESNINNYYGLYNDANDLSSTSFTVSGGTLSGSNTTDGFTCTTTTSSEVRANFKNPIPSLSSNSFTFHMSFNADLANPAGSSGNGSPIVRLLNSSEAVTTAAHTVTQGFNSFSNVVNQNAGTDSTILEFFDNDANTSYSISDIKISLIARNGFVETLYDQSGNGRDVLQDTAANQPTIVSNGGIYKTGNYPSVRYTDTDDTYLVTESYSPVEQGGSGMPNFTLFAVTGIPEAAGLDSIVSAGGTESSNTIGGFKLRHRIDGSNIDSRLDIAQTGLTSPDHRTNVQSNNVTPTSVNLNTSYLDSTDDELFVQQNSGTSGTTTTTLIPLSGQGAENDNLKVGTDMFNGSPRGSYLGEILEVILYTDSKKSELSDLTNEINNFYNI